MMDLAFVLCTIALFVLALLYLKACERLK